MKTIKAKYYIIPAVVCLVIIVGLGYYYFLTDFAKDSEKVNYVYIDDDDTADSVFTKRCSILPSIVSVDLRYWLVIRDIKRRYAQEDIQ